MPDGTSTTQAPAPPAALRDFSDRLPPVLVKELRQGLRGKMFVIPFLVLQGLLMLSSGQNSQAQTLFFWHCLAIMLVCLLPSRNLGALGEERQANTLDTLILTRLTPWRIVWGKWCATAAQSALTAVAAMPYLLVRYLNSGSNFVQEGMLLLALLLASGGMAGLFTAFSIIKSPLARNGLAGAAIIAVYVLLLRPLTGMVATFGMHAQLEGPAYAFITVMAVWTALFSLWQAAASIAPAAANLTTPRRLTSLAAVALMALLHETYPAPYLFGSLLAMLAAISMVEMGERPRLHPGVATSFARRGVAGRLAAVLFHPGWPSGVVFCLVLWGLTALLAGSANFWQVASLCFFPVTARCLLPASTRPGSAPMILMAAAAHLTSVLLMQLLPGNARYIASLLPSLQQVALAGTAACRQFAFVWAGAALVIAAKPLVLLLFIHWENPASSPSHEKSP